MTPIRAVVETPTRDRNKFLTYTITQPREVGDFDSPQVVEATMLILPPDRAQLPDQPPTEIGLTCRVCPRQACAARREPSILGDGP